MPVDQETFDLLKGYWVQEGGNPGSADVAAAVAFAESQGCQYALAGPRDIRPVKQCVWRQTDGENSCGYWQINLRAHPSYSSPSIFNPATNASAAVAISRDGADFGAWSTYTSGAYRDYLARFAGDAPTGSTQPQGDTFGSGDQTVQPGVWSQGWETFTRSVSRTLPTALAQSQHYGHLTLRRMQQGRKVGR